MQRILIFGAGKSAGALITYLLKTAASNNWTITVADAELALIEQKTKGHPAATAVVVDVTDNLQRKPLVRDADVVISMMPPALHYLIATDCLEFGKHLLTASYVDDKIRAMQDAVAGKGILFLCEMGLDPGIDHMSAMKIFHHLEGNGQKLLSFKSHCGGLVAPESDDNPWHYKISWNPRNVVLAGKLGARYLENGREKILAYDQIFDRNNMLDSALSGMDKPGYYANRDSIPYLETYGLHGLETFLRTTLRHPNFIRGWRKLAELGLTAETVIVPANELSFAAYYQQFADAQQFNWQEIFDTDPIFKQQMQALGFNDHEPIGLNDATAAAVLQAAMEKNWPLLPGDKDLVVMVHEIVFEIDGIKQYLQSRLVVTGEDNTHTAMAKTVGLPLAIAAKLLLNGQLNVKGLHIPVLPEIYEPVLAELEKEGIHFTESVTDYKESFRPDN